MEKNSNSSSSICRKIRQVLATNPAFRAIHRIKHHYREPRPVTAHANSPSLPPSTHFPQNIKAKTQGEGTVPIKFDSSIPTSSPMIHGKVSKVASPQVGISQVAANVEPEPWHVQESRGDVWKDEYNGKDRSYPPKEQGKKPLDINDTFSEYIQRTKYRIRTVSNVGQGQSYSAPDDASVSNNKMANHEDQFSDFIQRAKKKMRTTSSVGKTSSMRKGLDSE